MEPSKECATQLAALSQSGRSPNFGDDDGGRVIGGWASARAGLQPGTVGGIYTMSSANSKLFIDAGPQGALTGGHSHADASSIQLITDGRPILIDPGTFCYVCPERDRFRGTAAHNTLQVDGRDQAQPNGRSPGPICPKPLWIAGTPARLSKFSPAITTATLRSSITVGCSASKPDFGWCAIWLPSCDRQGAAIVSTSTGTFSTSGEIAILPAAEHTWSRSIEPWDWSPVYGRKEPAKVLRFSTEAPLPAEFAVLLIPGEARHFHANPDPALITTKNPRGRTNSYLATASLSIGPRPGGRHGVFTMKLLWVKAGGLLPPDMGGKIRSYNILKQLARRHEITLFTFYPGASR